MKGGFLIYYQLNTKNVLLLIGLFSLFLLINTQPLEAATITEQIEIENDIEVNGEEAERNSEQNTDQMENVHVESEEVSLIEPEFKDENNDDLKLNEISGESISTIKDGSLSEDLEAKLEQEALPEEDKTENPQEESSKISKEDSANSLKEESSESSKVIKSQIIALSSTKVGVSKVAQTSKFTAQHSHLTTQKEKVNVYASRSTNGQTLGFLKPNVEYQLKRVVDSNWLEVSFAGLTGYILQTDARPTDGKKVERKNPGLKPLWEERSKTLVKIMDNPDNPKLELGQLNANLTYKIVGTAGTKYVAIDIGNRLGYVAREQFTNATKYFVPAYETKVQGYQNGEFQTLGTITGNEEYQLHRLVGNDWVTFNYGGVEGYIQKKDARPGDGTKMERKNPGLGTLWIEYAKKPLKIMNNPDNPTKVLGTIQTDTLYKVVGTAGVNYYAIDLGKRLGYVERPQFTSAIKHLLPAYETKVYSYQNGKLQVVGTVTGNEEYKLHRIVGSDWVTLNYGGFEGYIKKKDARPGNGSKMERKNPGLGTLWKEQSKRSLKIVNNPDNPSKILGTIYANTLYKVVGTAGVNYYAIDLGNRLGYVAREQFTNTTKYFLPAYSTSVYENINGKSIQVGKLNGNIEYQLKRIVNKDWIVFNFGGKEGYIKQKDARPGNGQLFDNKNPNLPVLHKGKANANVTLYLRPDMNSTIVGHLNKNETFSIVGTAGHHLMAIDVGGRFAYVPIQAYVNISNKVPVLKKIVIDPGHGGSDSGAPGNGLFEKNITLALAKKTQYYLNTYYTGHEVRLTRTDDTFVSLSDRAKMANDWGADVFVSIHLNAFNGAATGYEDYRHSTKTNGVELQNTMHQHIASIYKSNGIQDRGKKEANYAVLRETKMPAILTENGFIDNSNDMEKMKQDWFQNQVAKAHADGIAEFLGLRRK